MDVKAACAPRSSNTLWYTLDITLRSNYDSHFAIMDDVSIQI